MSATVFRSRLHLTALVLVCAVTVAISGVKALADNPRESILSPEVQAQLQRQALDVDPTADITLVSNGSSSVYKRASLQSFTQAYIKLTGVDLNDDKLIDDFAMINYCDVYQQYFKDEFAWRQARDAFRRLIQRELENYAENVYVLGSVTMGRYDFESKSFILDDPSKFNQTGRFRFYDRNFSCTGGVVQQLPLTYDVRLTNPITLDRLEIPEEKAQQIIRIMEQQENRDRRIYVTFFLRINDFSTQGGSLSHAATRTRATLVSARFYLDRQRKIQIYEYNGNKN